tara:strand:- start:2540 stop:3232 length:693 start_codon:yes stop_codon:yes gene_type:complete
MSLLNKRIKPQGSSESTITFTNTFHLSPNLSWPNVSVTGEVGSTFTVTTSTSIASSQYWTDTTGTVAVPSNMGGVTNISGSVAVSGLTATVTFTGTFISQDQLGVAAQVQGLGFSNLSANPVIFNMGPTWGNIPDGGSTIYMQVTNADGFTLHTNGMPVHFGAGVTSKTILGNQTQYVTFYASCFCNNQTYNQSAGTIRASKTGYYHKYSSNGGTYCCSFANDCTPLNGC